MKTRFVLTMTLLLATTAHAQSNGRITFFGSMQRADYGDGTTRDFSEFTAYLTLRSPEAQTDGLEYAFDVRGSAYPSTDRDSRTNVYDAWAGGRMAGGRLALRAGQMWLHELGSLGSVGGAMVEYRSQSASPAGRLRLGLFGGVEPKHFDTGYVSDVKKGGAWIALDGTGTRRHILGYVLIRNANLTERSVITTTNFIPAGKRFFLYQAAEYDLTGPGGRGKGGLNYIFANARYTPVRPLEVMLNYHHGRSIDARTITDDISNGRPVDQKALNGYLFESIGGRVTVEVVRNVRLHAGYATDKHNRDDKSYGRISAGIWASDIAGSGFDLTLSDNRMDREGGSHDAWYASVGRRIGSKVYVSLDYATSLAIVRIVGDGGAIIEHRPRTRRYGVSSVWHLTRVVSVILNAEELKDETSKDDRVVMGVTYRF